MSGKEAVRDDIALTVWRLVLHKVFPGLRFYVMSPQINRVIGTIEKLRADPSLIGAVGTLQGYVWSGGNILKDQYERLRSRLLRIRIEIDAFPHSLGAPEVDKIHSDMLMLLECVEHRDIRQAREAFEYTGFPDIMRWLFGPWIAKDKNPLRDGWAMLMTVFILYWLFFALHLILKATERFICIGFCQS